MTVELQRTVGRCLNELIGWSCFFHNYLTCIEFPATILSKLVCMTVSSIVSFIIHSFVSAFASRVKSMVYFGLEFAHVCTPSYVWLGRLAEFFPQYYSTWKKFPAKILSYSYLYDRQLHSFIQYTFVDISIMCRNLWSTFAWSLPFVEVFHIFDPWIHFSDS
jgi:hypothetical protein